MYPALGCRRFTLLHIYLKRIQDVVPSPCNSCNVYGHSRNPSICPRLRVQEHICTIVYQVHVHWQSTCFKVFVSVVGGLHIHNGTVQQKYLWHSCVSPHMSYKQRGIFYRHQVRALINSCNNYRWLTRLALMQQNRYSANFERDSSEHVIWRGFTSRYQNCFSKLAEVIIAQIHLNHNRNCFASRFWWAEPGPQTLPHDWKDKNTGIGWL